MVSNGEKFITCGQMKLLERRADENGLSYYQMMENAGSGAAEYLMSHLNENHEGIHSEDENKAIYVFCGKGNNGGDGFVVARIMHDGGYNVKVVLVDGKPKTEDAITNLELLKERPIELYDLTEDGGALLKLKPCPVAIVDAIYGTGFKGELSGNGLKAAIYINKFKKEVDERIPVEGLPLIVALDIPSGLSGDLNNKAELETNSVVADITIAFHSKKPVHLKNFAEGYLGDVVVVDIGIDEELLWKIDV